MFSITDHLGRSLTFDKTPLRIVSLVPSQTELLVDLCLRENILGITKFCIHPSSLKQEKKIVGGTKKVNFEKIKALNPDIILCNKEENTEVMVQQLMTIAPVHVSDIRTVESVFSLIKEYGVIFSRQKEADLIIQKVQEARVFFTEKSRNTARSVAYLIWQNPLMVAGAPTFINALLEELGFINPFKNYSGRYPEINKIDLNNVDEIFLSSEPYPFTEVHRKEIGKYTDARITLVDGEYFSWYGSRLINAYPYFRKLLSDLKL